MKKTAIHQLAHRGKTTLRRKFSLIELLIAMTILVLIMTMILGILATSQRNWQTYNGRTRIYQTSRVIFDLLERDIRAMALSSVEGQSIGYHIYAHNAASSSTADAATFVSSMEPADAAKSRLCEVTYRFHRDRTGDANTAFILQRQQVCENDSPDWDFYNLPTDWYLNDSTNAPEFETVAAGVLQFNIRFYAIANDGSNSIIEVTNANIAQYRTQTPIRVVVDLVLFDSAMMGAEYDSARSKTQRAFTKVFYLSTLN